jgi:hypothetical protein
MKKLLLTLLIAPILTFSQDLDFSKAYSIKAYSLEIDSSNDLFQEMINSVPNGEVWYVYLENDISVSGIEFEIDSEKLNGIPNIYTTTTMSSGYFTAGESISVTNYNQNNTFRMRYVVFKFKINSQAVLASASSEIIENKFDRPTLYPNPTSSLLALNSDKEYDIEVYDMAGNKVMALTGNTIDMSHLSSATYIVKALDKVENEEMSYKVVKN